MIRKVHLEDNKKLLELFLRLDEETSFMMYEKGERETTPDQMVSVIEKIIKSGSIIFVEDNGYHLNGYIYIGKGEHNRTKHSGHIVIGIVEESTGQGLGTKLFEEAIEWAKTQGMTRLGLTVMVNNHRGVHLYEKMGFELEGRRNNSLLIDGEYVDEFYMSKLL